MTTSLFLEGLSGAGKTSIMVTLAATLGDCCLGVPEVNPPPTQPGILHTLASEAITSWYLDRESRRDRFAARLAARPQPRLAVFDRSYLSVLAYAYAASATTGEPAGYCHARRVFDHDIRPCLESGATIVLITTTVPASLGRRRDKQDRKFEHQWYRRDFLEALNDFYRDEAPKLCVGPLRVLDTAEIAEDRIVAAVLGAVGDRELTRDLNADKLRSPLVPRLRAEQLSHHGVRMYYEDHGGVRTFGQPLGPLIKHYAGTTQFFERHALLLDDAGAITPFDPVTPETDDW